LPHPLATARRRDNWTARRVPHQVTNARRFGSVPSLPLPSPEATWMASHMRCLFLIGFGAVADHGLPARGNQRPTHSSYALLVGHTDIMHMLLVSSKQRVHKEDCCQTKLRESSWTVRECRSWDDCCNAAHCSAFPPATPRMTSAPFPQPERRRTRGNRHRICFILVTTMRSRARRSLNPPTSTSLGVGGSEVQLDQPRTARCCMACVTWRQE
jgi:hypothetical protein